MADTTDTEFRAKDRVVAALDLPGVPEGTPGVVLQVTGMEWIRYRVRFANGIERNLIDGRYLAKDTGRKR